jgi:O-antigen/teichoic acid export membrane protein
MNPIKAKILSLLRKSEKYTRTDMTYIAKGGAWLTSAQIISSLLSLLLAIAFANLVSKEIYGTYKYVFSLFALLSIPALSGMGTAITQAVARGYEGSIIPAFKEKIKWGTLGSLASIAVAIYYYINNNDSFALIFLVMAFFLPFLNSFFIYSSLLGGKRLFRKATEYGVMTQIIGTLVLIGVLYAYKNIFAIIFAYLIIFTLLNGFFFFLTLKRNPPNKTVDPESLSLGRHLSYIDIIVTGVGQLDKILLFHFIGPEALAIYSFALAPVAQLRGLFKTLMPLAQ